MNSTHKKHSKRKIVISAISIVCALATLLGVASFALSSLFPSAAEDTSLFDGLYTDSAQAVDFENAVYRIDDSGNVWEENSESIRLVMRKDARLLAVYDSDIYVLTESVKGYLLSKLDVLHGSIYDSKNLGKNEIKCFSMTKSGVYYLSDSKIFLLSSDNKTSAELDLSKLSYEERNIYDLVVRRFLAVLSAPFEYDEMQVKITVGKHNFYTKGQAVKSAGWKALYDSSLSEDDDDGDDICDFCHFI